MTVKEKIIRLLVLDCWQVTSDFKFNCLKKEFQSTLKNHVAHQDSSNSSPNAQLEHFFLVSISSEGKVTSMQHETTELEMENSMRKSDARLPCDLKEERPELIRFALIIEQNISFDWPSTTPRHFILLYCSTFRRIEYSSLFTLKVKWHQCRVHSSFRLQWTIGWRDIHQSSFVLQLKNRCSRKRRLSSTSKPSKLVEKRFCNDRDRLTIERNLSKICFLSSISHLS